MTNPSQGRLFWSEAVEEEEMYPFDMPNILNPCGMHPHKLVLKEGALVAIIRNMSRSDGIMNGSHAIVAKCCTHRVQVRLTSGPKAGHDVAVPRINLQSPDNGTLHINFTRRQFPLRLAFCMTINKSQGQTFRNVGVWLPSPVFSHGQLYVALSRLGDPNGLCIASQPTMHADALEQGIPNIVWSELIPPQWWLIPPPNAELPAAVCYACNQPLPTSYPSNPAQRGGQQRHAHDTAQSSAAPLSPDGPSPYNHNRPDPRLLPDDPAPTVHQAPRFADWNARCGPPPQQDLPPRKVGHQWSQWRGPPHAHDQWGNEESEDVL